MAPTLPSKSRESGPAGAPGAGGWRTRSAGRWPFGGEAPSWAGLSRAAEAQVGGAAPRGPRPAASPEGRGGSEPAMESEYYGGEQSGSGAGLREGGRARRGLSGRGERPGPALPRALSWVAAARRPSAAAAGPRRAGTGLSWGRGRPAGRSRAPEGVWSRCGRAARALRDPPVAGLRGALGSAPGRPARGLSAGAPRCWGLSAFPVTRRGCQGASRRWETSPSFTF